MRINEYKSLDEFKSEFTGEWSPSNGHWYSLDFFYNGEEYRLNTGSMYNKTNTVFDDGTVALFSIYHRKDDNDYILLGEYPDMSSLLEECIIAGKKFKEIIMDDSTKILGKD